MKKFTTIYVARHGLSEGNVRGEVAGSYDTPLIKEGEEQAKKLALQLRKIQFDAIFSSDLIRAKRTAEIVAVEKKLAVETSKMLREINFGTFEGKKETKKIIKLFDDLERLAYPQWLRHKLNEDAETIEEIIGRFITFLKEVAATYKGKTILVVSHGTMMRSLLVHLGYAPHTKLIHGTIKNTGYVKLETDGIDFFIKETHNIKLPA